MSKRSETPAEVLISAPWWISATLAPVSFVVLRWVVPYFMQGRPFGPSLSVVVSAFAPYVALFFVLTGGLSLILGFRRRLLVEGQTGLDSLRRLSWKEFEGLVAEAFRRKGYSVEESLGGGPDGGIDVVLRKDGETTIVQCKHWKVFSVGVSVVRELFGVMTADRAERAIVITSGKFTREAEAFAEGKPIQLIDGPALLEMVQGVQRKSPPRASRVESIPAKEPTCPQCGIPMVLRTAGKGPNAGSQFWGCRNYPRCRQNFKMSRSD